MFSKVSSISTVSRHIQRATTALGLLRIYHVEAPLALLRRGAKSTYHEQELLVFKRVVGAYFITAASLQLRSS